MNNLAFILGDREGGAERQRDREEGGRRRREELFLTCATSQFIL